VEPGLAFGLGDKMIAGIYLIKNTANGKAYVGQSINIKQRITNHRHYLRKGIHPNKHLQASFSKYGEKNFIFEIIEKSFDNEKLTELESKWIESYGSTDNRFGYNIMEADRSARTKPMPDSFIKEVRDRWKNYPDDKKEKIRVTCRESQKKRWATMPDGDRAVALANLHPPKPGRKLTEEEKLEIGRRWSALPADEKDRISSKVSLAAKEMWNTASREKREIMLKNLSAPKSGYPAWNKGMKMSTEHREKLKQAWVIRKSEWGPMGNPAGVKRG
jgi:group I intron endonuclease